MSGNDGATVTLSNLYGCDSYPRIPPSSLHPSVRGVGEDPAGCRSWKCWFELVLFTHCSFYHITGGIGAVAVHSKGNGARGLPHPQGDCREDGHVPDRNGRHFVILVVV